jgi:thiol-disulfide isomerase/thioredoxin
MAQSPNRRAVLASLALLPVGLAACGSRDLTATDIEQVSVNGIVRRVQEGAGELVVLYVFASWCSSCQEAQNVFNHFAARYRRKVRFVVVSVDEDIEALAAFLNKHGAPFDPLVSPMAKGEKLAPALAPLGATYPMSIPYGAIFGRDGTLVREWTGGASIDSLTGTVDPLLI